MKRKFIIRLESFEMLNQFESDLNTIMSPVNAKVDSVDVDARSQIGMLYICALVKPVEITIVDVSPTELKRFNEFMKKYEGDDNGI